MLVARGVQQPASGAAAKLKFQDDVEISSWEVLAPTASAWKCWT